MAAKCTISPQSRGDGLLLVRAWPPGPCPAQTCSPGKAGPSAGKPSDLGDAVNPPQFLCRQNRTWPPALSWAFESRGRKAKGGQLLPDDAPVRLNPHDGGVLHVLEEQVLWDLGPVHLHCHFHLQHLLRGCGVADDGGWRAPAGREDVELGSWGWRGRGGPGSDLSYPVPVAGTSEATVSATSDIRTGAEPSVRRGLVLGPCLQPASPHSQQESC